MLKQDYLEGCRCRFSCSVWRVVQQITPADHISTYKGGAVYYMCLFCGASGRLGVGKLEAAGSRPRCVSVAPLHLDGMV